MKVIKYETINNLLQVFCDLNTNPETDVGKAYEEGARNTSMMLNEFVNSVAFDIEDNND